jgi:nitrogen regulatory protein PII
LLRIFDDKLGLQGRRDYPHFKLKTHLNSKGIVAGVGRLEIATEPALFPAACAMQMSRSGRRQNGRPIEMKRIEMVIEPAALGRLTETVDALNLPEFDVTEVRCAPIGNRRQRQRIYRGRQFVVDLVERLKVDLTVDDEMATRVLDKLVENVRPQSVAVLRLDLTAVTAVDNTRPQYAHAALRV